MAIKPGHIIHMAWFLDIKENGFLIRHEKEKMNHRPCGDVCSIIKLRK